MNTNLNMLTPQELDALERGIRKIREDQARQRAEAQRQRSGPVCLTGHVFVRMRRNGQNSMPVRCDSVAEAFDTARKHVADHHLPLFLVDADEDFETKSVERGDGVYYCRRGLRSLGASYPQARAMGGFAQSAAARSVLRGARVGSAKEVW